jgi:hypothetical protein
VESSDLQGIIVAQAASGHPAFLGLCARFPDDTADHGARRPFRRAGLLTAALVVLAANAG